MTEHNKSQQKSTVPVFDAPEGSSMVTDVFDRIETESVKPRSKWYFICKNEIFWGLGLFSIIIGSVSVAAGLFAVSYIELDFYTVTHDSLIGFLLDTLPLMWVICFLAFIVLGYVQIKNTRRGYKYSFVIVVGSTFIMSLVGGGVLHTYGFGALLEKAVENRIPFHNSAFVEREQIWLKAERGVIAGEVVYIERDNSSFVLKDWSGKPWLINSQDLMEMDMSILKENTMIRVIGLPAIVNEDSLLANSMHACFILPWVDSHKVALNNSQIELDIDLNNINVPVDNTATNIERNIEDLRSNECKGVRPYQLIQRLRAEAK